MSATVTNRPERSRYEIDLDGEPAGFTQYHLEDDVVAFDHTEIDPAFEGRGLASVLIKHALDDVRSRGLGVRPFCPFVRRYIDRHAEYRDLVR